MTKTEAARTGALTEIVSVRQGDKSLGLTFDRYVFDRPHGLLEATADLRNALVRRVQLTSPPIASQGNATYQVSYRTQELGLAPHIEVPAAKDVFHLPH